MGIVFTGIVFIICNIWAIGMLTYVALNEKSQGRWILFGFPIALNVLAVIASVLTVVRHFNAS